MCMKTAHDIWLYLNLIYGSVSNDDDASSNAHDDTTSCTLDGNDDGSCFDDDCDATTSPSPHCLMSQGDTKVQNANVVHHVDSYDGLVSKLASMTMSLENEKAKTLKLENENLFLKNSCEEHKHLMFLNIHMVSYN